MINVRISFAIVPIPTVRIGITNPETITNSENKPVIYPIIVLNKQLKPRGIPVIKSKNKPEKKPVVSPKDFPFNKEKYNKQIKAKSGTT